MEEEEEQQQKGEDCQRGAEERGSRREKTGEMRTGRIRRRTRWKMKAAMRISKS